MARLKNDYDFLAGVFIEGELHFNRYHLVLNMYTTGYTNDDQNTAFARIEYFIQDVVQRSIFVAEDDTAAIARFSAAGIPVLTVPGNAPHDQVVQAVVVTKINAFLESVLVVSQCEIASIVGGFVTYVYDLDDRESEEILEYINDENTDMWWACDDPRFVSMPTPAKPEIDWKELRLEWEADRDPDVEIVFTPEFDADAPETVIQMSDFNKDK